MKTKLQSAVVMVIFSISMLTSTPAESYSTTKHFSVNLSLIVDLSNIYRYPVFLENFYQIYGFKSWSLVITLGVIEHGFLENSSFVNSLKQYGELLPGFWAPQSHDNSWKKEKIDSSIGKWQKYVGYKPSGWFMYHPDTYVSNYLWQKGVKYIQGYCFDQYAIDWMSMRGGWQQPYYASREHVLAPAKTGQSTIIFPAAIWDWRDSLELHHMYNSGPVDAWEVFGHDYEAAREYVLKLMEATYAAVEPFAYFVCQDEIYGWNSRFLDDSIINHTDFFGSVLLYAKKLGATVETMSETAEYFLRNYPSNPTYKVRMVSPFSGKTSEWLWNTWYRIGRYDSNIVVSYVEYSKQGKDRYLTKVHDPSNYYNSSLDPQYAAGNSLNFTIDDSGNGVYRAPPRGDKRFYTGSLFLFRYEMVREFLTSINNTFRRRSALYVRP